jgi:hypothetical protein
MLLTEAQLKLFWRTWAAACKAQGWTRENGLKVADVNAKRHEVLQGLGFSSLTRVTKRDGFDRLIARVRTLAGNLQGAVDEVVEESGERKRQLYRLECALKCLGLYMTPEESAKYVHKICVDKFAPRGSVRRGWEELDHRPRTASALNGRPRLRMSELEELIITIMGRLNGRTGFRAKAGHSVHEMLAMAGVPCACATCRPTDAQATPRPARPVQPAEPEPVEVAAGDTNEPF